jgi:4-hydroxybenzoate polyprenyltransferase
MYLVAFGLVYPIVYIYNDITDVEKDKLNKKRLKYKPLAA